VTVVSPNEFADLPQEASGEIEGKRMIVVLGGISRVRPDLREAVFVVGDAPEINFLRKKAQLPTKDVHMTLGISPDDVHDIRKDDPNIWRP